MNLNGLNYKSGKFKYLKSRETCCACGQTGKGCRELNTIDTTLYFCHGENISPDYNVTRLDKNGVFAICIHKDDIEKQQNEFAEEREKRRQEYIAQRKADQERQVQESAAGLPTELRDREFRKLISQLPLSEHHRKDLEHHGLTPEQIEKGMFRSVSTKGTKLSIPISQFLPGACSGILIRNIYSQLGIINIFLSKQIYRLNCISEIRGCSK